jgi:hypothetical protein
VVPDMSGGRGAQMAPAEAPGDVGHGGNPFLFVPMTILGFPVIVNVT